jgi:hypothetical protein
VTYSTGIEFNVSMPGNSDLRWLRERTQFEP